MVARHAALSRLLAATLTLSAAGLAGCAVNPVSKLPEVVFMSVEREVAIGREAKKTVEARMHLHADDALVEYVRSVGRRLVKHSPRKNIHYTFDVVDDEAVNAFALPGGPLFIHRELLAWMNSEDELASVLGHEIGHTAARHHVKGDVRRKAASAGAFMAVLTGAVLGGQAGANMLGSLGQAGAQGYVSSFSRGQETEADKIGQLMMARSSWNPAASSDALAQLRRWRSLELGGLEPGEGGFFSSHPGIRERIETTRDRARTIPRAGSVDAVSIDRKTYLDRIDGIVLGQNPAWGVLVAPKALASHHYEDERSIFLHYDMGFRVRFPYGWDIGNFPRALTASDGLALQSLELLGNDIDLAAAPELWLENHEKERKKAKAAKKKPGPEIEVVRQGKRRFRKSVGRYLEVKTKKGKGRIGVYFVPVRKKVFQLECIVAEPDDFKRYARECRITANRIRRISKSERARVKLRRLQIVEALPNERLADFRFRVESAWDVHEIAARNAIDASRRLSAGQRIKVAVDTPYTGAPTDPEPPTDALPTVASPPPDEGTAPADD